MKEIYLAGGCFWGMEHALQLLHGIIETEAGYANGTLDHPSYEAVCTDTTGHRETVRAVYDPERISLETILKAYFICIDPTLKNRQAGDIGSQYQTGIYTVDADSETRVETYLKEERKKYPAFFVEYGPLKSFWPAEEYHQKYLDKTPGGYCHVSQEEFRKIRELNETEETA